jgi:hypothetical protein
VQCDYVTSQFVLELRRKYGRFINNLLRKTINFKIIILILDFNIFFVCFNGVYGFPETL